MAQQNVPDNDPRNHLSKFVLSLDDHNLIHVEFKREHIGMSRILEIVLRKYDAHFDEWPVSKEFICSVPQDIFLMPKMKSLLLKVETEELYALLSKNNMTRTYTVETTKHSVLLHVNDIIAVTECKSESSGMLLQIPHDSELPVESKIPVSTIHVPSRHMILQFREDPSVIRRYCFFTKQWSGIEGLRKNKNHHFLFISYLRRNIVPIRKDWNIGAEF